MDAIYQYLFDSNFASYFTLYRDNQGLTYDTEILGANVQSFINDAISAGVFTGSDGSWESTDNLTLTEIAKEMKITEEVAFTLVSLLEVYDASWVIGDHDSLLEELVENQIQVTTSKVE